MGGTLDRLIEQGHEVHVAYQTSGNIAVSDQEALKFAEVSNSLTNNKITSSIIGDLINKNIDSIDTKIFEI